MIYGGDDGSVSRQAMRCRGWSVGLARSMALLTIAGLLLGSCRGMEPQGRPAAPVPALGSHDHTSATVTWSKPDTDLEITGYELRWRQASDTAWNQVRELAPTTTEYTITELQAGTEYEVQVRAVFATDVGAWSQSITVTTEAAPDPTPKVLPEMKGLTFVKITWSEPVTDLEITGYGLRWRQASDTEWNEVPELRSTTKDYTIVSLQAGAEYEVQVRAVFASGGGTWSESVTVETITADKIYWVESNGKAIKQADLDGGNPATLIATGSNTDPAGIALSANKMYWTDQGDDTIKCADLEGIGVKTLVRDLSAPSGIALDVAGGKMYWTETRSDSNNDTIKRADLDDKCEGSVEDSVEGMVTNAKDPQDLALDVAKRKMYWTDRGTGSIKFASMDGDNTPMDLITGLTQPQGIALDLANRVIYWTETGSEDDVLRANLEDVTDRTIIYNGSGSSPHGMAIDGVNDKVYWVDYDADTIESASADLEEPPAPETLISDLDQPRDIALGR